MQLINNDRLYEYTSAHIYYLQLKCYRKYAIIKNSFKNCYIYIRIYTVSGIKILNIFDCNAKKDYQILIIFDTNNSDTTGDQIAVQFFTAPIVCFCTTWGNKTNEILHSYPILPVRVFRSSAEANI